MNVLHEEQEEAAALGETGELECGLRLRLIFTLNMILHKFPNRKAKRSEGGCSTDVVGTTSTMSVPVSVIRSEL